MFAQTGLGIEERWIHTVFLLAIRFGTFALVAPPLASVQIPTLVRITFIGALSVMLAISLPFARLPAALPLSALLSAACMEFAIGFSMALGVALAFAAFTTGAQLLDLQIGFSLGQVLDPLTRQRLPVLTSALNQLAIIGFFSTNSHLAS